MIEDEIFNQKIQKVTKHKAKEHFKAIIILLIGKEERVTLTISVKSRS